MDARGATQTWASAWAVGQHPENAVLVGAQATETCAYLSVHDLGSTVLVGVSEAMRHACNALLFNLRLGLPLGMHSASALFLFGCWRLLPAAAAFPTKSLAFRTSP